MTGSRTNLPIVARRLSSTIWFRQPKHEQEWPVLEPRRVVDLRISKQLEDASALFGGHFETILVNPWKTHTAHTHPFGQVVVIYVLE